jgi:hypothetical protein
MDLAMQYTLKNINELRVPDLKTVMRPAAAVRLIQGQSEIGAKPNITNLTDFNVGTHHSSANNNNVDQLSRHLETGHVVIVQSDPLDEFSVLSSVGRLSTHLPEALSSKVKDLFVAVRATSSINRTIPYELISKESAINSLAAEQINRSNQAGQSSVSASSSIALPTPVGRTDYFKSDPRSTIISEFFYIELVDDDEAPVPFVSYLATFPDGIRKTGRLDKNGKAKVPCKTHSQCSITFPRETRSESLTAV